MKTQAKKVYKQLIKDQKVARKNRMPFNQFFKQYKAAQQSKVAASDAQEDFDFEQMVSSTNVTDGAVETVEVKEGGSGADSIVGEVVGQVDVLNSVSGVSEAEMEEV